MRTMAKDLPTITVHNPTRSALLNFRFQKFLYDKVFRSLDADYCSSDKTASLKVTQPHGSLPHGDENMVAENAQTGEGVSTSCRQCMFRSRSQDRLWNEASRFYDAVGEVGVKEIIEDDSSCSCSEEEARDQERYTERQVREVPHCVNVLASFDPSNPQDMPIQRARGSEASNQSLSTCKHSFSHLLPHQTTGQNFVYRGISANPPEITQRGIARGNGAQIHRKAWLEVSDAKHRYGKNLRMYYRHWESLGFPTDNFFDWLDSKGDASGQPLPSIEACPRSDFDSDTVLYITNPDDTRKYALKLTCDGNGRCRVFDAENNPVSTGNDGWIFVLRDGAFYGARKVCSTSAGGTHQRFHHSSFFGGRAVAAAGIFVTDRDGVMTMLYPHSGHYRPGEADVQRTLHFFHQLGVDLNTFEVDTQQLIRVNRHEVTKSVQEGKKKKVDSLHLKPAVDVAHFLAHKARSQVWMSKICTENLKDSNH